MYTETMSKTLFLIIGCTTAVLISGVIGVTTMTTDHTPEPTVTHTVTMTPEPAPTVTVTATPEPAPTVTVTSAPTAPSEELLERCSTDDWYMDPVCVAASEGN